MYTRVRQCVLWYVQLPSWGTQPGIAKMPEVKGNGGSQAQGGQVRVRETRIHTTRPAPSPLMLDIRAWPRQDWIFYVYICWEINTC